MYHYIIFCFNETDKQVVDIPVITDIRNMIKFRGIDFVLERNLYLIFIIHYISKKKIRGMPYGCLYRF